jgi:4-carboxymuconolactone decarboxylase
MVDREDRRRLGAEMFQKVYGDVVPPPPAGASEGFDLLILEQQFAELWARPALPIPLRRLLTVGVVAARGEYQTLELQFRRMLDVGELDEEQVREAAMHLISYAGTPAAGGIFAASEQAIAAHQKQAAAEPRDDA